MAEERQKRLLIKEYDLVCDLNDCKYCEEKDWCSEKDTMTRQEAIERMAMAMHNEDIKRNIKDIPCDYRNLAEAALTAIAPMIPQEDNNER